MITTAFAHTLARRLLNKNGINHLRRFLISAMFLVLGLGSNAQAEKQCRDIFAKVVKPRMTVLDLLKVEREMPTEVLENILTLKSVDEKIDYAATRLKKAGVDFKIIVEKVADPKMNAYGLKSRRLIVIKPSNATYLNQLARSVLKLYQTRVRFDPGDLPPEMGAAFEPNDKILYISQLTAYTGQPDNPFFHELKHMAMDANENKGKPSILNGNATLEQELWPWGAPKSGYVNGFSYQELATYFLGLNYERLGYKALLAEPRLSVEDVDHFLSGLVLDAHSAGDMFEDMHHAARFELEQFKKGDGVVFYDPEFDDLVLFFDKPGHYAFRHRVPSRRLRATYSESMLKATRPQLDYYFNTDEHGIESARHVAELYLKDLENSAKARVAYSIYFRALEAHFMIQAAKFLERPDPNDATAEDRFLREFIVKFLGEKTLNLGPKASSLETDYLPITPLLPADGFKFENVAGSSMIEREINLRTRDAEAVREALTDAIARNAPESAYGQFNLRVSYQGLQSDLLIEWNSETSTDQINFVESFQASGGKILSASMKALTKDASHSADAIQLARTRSVVFKLRNRDRVSVALKKTKQ